MTTLREQFEAMIKEKHRTYNPDYGKWILDLMQKAYNMPRWVECSERLPPKLCEVLAFCLPNETIEPAIINSDGIWKETSYGERLIVTHWQPLPSPPTTQK